TRLVSDWSSDVCSSDLSELLPYKAKMVDQMCFIRTMHTEAINHEPAISAMQTGNQVTGRPCLGAWTSYGLGSLNKNLPTFVVLRSEERRVGKECRYEWA